MTCFLGVAVCFLRSGQRCRSDENTIIVAWLRKEGLMIPAWAYLAVALAIAMIAFGIGQILPGLGVPFVVLISTAWTGYSIQRRRKLSRSC
jgi:hypothetical protein